MASARTPANFAEAMDIRAMVKDTIRSGKDIDRQVDGSNTLLHLAVKKDLVDCVIKLLSSGADANIVNDEGYTARDIAIDNGNQILLQVLSRREEYTMHLRLFNRCTDVSSSNSNLEQFQVLSAIDQDGSTTDAKMVPLTIGAVYDDYIDWTDSQRCTHLQKLVENLRNDEFELKRAIDGLNTRRIRNNTRLQELHASLRDREHGLCLEVWSAIQAERHSRRALERASSEVERIKGLLRRALSYVHYRGTVRVAPYKKVFFSSWHYSLVEITGSMLVVDSPRHDDSGFLSSGSNSPKPGDRASFSLSFGNKARSVSRSGSGSGAALGRTRPTSDGHDTSEEGGTDTSGTAATCAHTEAMLAAHALGRDGALMTPASHEEAGSYSADLHASSRSKSKAFLSYSTGPVRRKLQKLHDGCGIKRMIPVQDIVSVEIYKEDRSLGSSYVQIELRIHYLKEGHGRQRAQDPFFSPMAMKGAFHVDGGDGGVTRERLLSNSSANGSGSRSTSTNSASGTALNIPTAHSTPAKAPGTSTNTKQRSLSTGGNARSAFDPRTFSTDSNHGAGPATSSSKAAATSAQQQQQQHHHYSADKLETIWLKLPLQSNTTTRAQAAGKKKRPSLAADDGSGGPTLTFELFISILKKVKENVRVFTVSHGVETTYMVNPVASISDLSSASPSVQGTAASTPSRASRTAVVGSPISLASPGGTLHKRNASSGNLADQQASDLSIFPPRRANLQRDGMKAPPLSPMAEDRGSVGSPGSCRTDSSSISPKRIANSTTFSSRLSSNSNSTAGAASSSSYHAGGSMNSASGLTSIESLVGMTRSSHHSHSHSHSHSMSMSGSGSMSSSGSSSGSYAAHSLSQRSYSPRYGRKLVHEDALLEETTADLEGMEDEDGDAGSEASPLHAALATDDDTSATEDQPQFLKLTRRHTEGNDSLCAKPRSAPVFAKAPEQMYAEAAQASLRGASFCSFGLDGQQGEEVAAAMSMESADMVTTRHTISLAEATDAAQFTAAVCSPVPEDASQPVEDCDASTVVYGSPERRTRAARADLSLTAPISLSRTGSYTDGHRARRPSSSFDAVYPESPQVLRRRDSNRALTTGNVGGPETRQQRRSSDVSHTSSPRAERLKSLIGEDNRAAQSGGLGQTLTLTKPSHTAVDEEVLVMYPIKLGRMLERARNKRMKIETRLVELLTSREKMRECVQYLQSLRAIVDNPPPTPTRSLAKTKAPSIDKAMLLLSVYGDHINQITEGLPPSSAMRLLASPAGAQATDFRGNLNDAEEFVRVMLQVNSTALTTSTVTSHGYNEIPGFNYNGERESFSSASGRTGGRCASVSTISTQRLTSSHSVSPLVRRLFADESAAASRTTSMLRQSFATATTPTFVCDPTPQLLRAPPPGYKADFDMVMSHLEEMWNCELESFQTVERLAQCLEQRAHTWKRLTELREQEQSMALPTKEDLYDVDF